MKSSHQTIFQLLPTSIIRSFFNSSKQYLVIIGYTDPVNRLLVQELRKKIYDFILYNISEIENTSVTSYNILNKVLCLTNQQNILGLFEKKFTLSDNHDINQNNIFKINLDKPLFPIGCVIMASGIGQRFGSNKLMHPFHEQPLISHILEITNTNLFSDRIVVTRHSQIQSLCEKQNIPVLMHTLPNHNDTIHLGLKYLIKNNPNLSGCLFTVSDQPLLSRETLETLLLTFSQDINIISPSPLKYDNISRLSFQDKPGNPVIFGSFYFNELLHLPNGKGGGVLLKKYGDKIHDVDAAFPEELLDIDTPEDLQYLLKSPYDL